MEQLYFQINFPALMINNVYGLVVCGGQSVRMGKDKSLLDYHGRPQRYYLYELLQHYCEKVFLSCNETQAAGIAAGYSYISDLPEYRNIGPMSALLSAFALYPQQSFIVAACDYPLFSEKEINALIPHVHAATPFAAFCHADNSIYEPLLAVYNPSSASIISRAFDTGAHSLQRLLKTHYAMKIFADTDAAIQSTDTYEDYLRIKKQLGR